MKVTEYIERFSTPKAKLASDIGIHRVQLYAFLEPTKYADIAMTDETLGKIADFEGRSLAAVKREYQSRKVAA